MIKSIYALLAVAGVSVLVSALVLFQPTYACEDDSSQEDDQVVVVPYSDEIYITEVLPNPSGEESTDEFIELYNSSNTTVDLTGWELSDSISRNYTISGSISAGQYVTFYREVSGVALNNSGDSIELYQPDGTLLDVVEYADSAEEDVSYALADDDEWYWTTTMTPGRSNTITGITDGTEDSESSEEDEDTKNTDDINDEEDNLQGYDFSDHIELSEVLPDPEGSDVTDEWIELHNTGSTAVDLYGWQVADPSKVYTISESTELSSNGYLVLSVIDTGISLNNSGDTITLYDPAGDVMDEISYTDSETGYSYARVSGSWNWTSSLTPGESNIITASAESETTSRSAASTVSTTQEDTASEAENARVISIAAAKQLSKGDSVIIQGTVNVQPGILGTQFFYVQDETSGIQIYSSQKEFPEIAVGDTVQVSGKLSEANGEVKINITDAADIVVNGHIEELIAIEVTDYTESQLGMLVQIAGEVTEKSGSTIVFDTGWNVYIKRSTGLSTTTFTEGEHIGVVGVLTASDDGIRILPRGEVDVTKITSEVAERNTETKANSFIPAANASTSATGDNIFSSATKQKNLPDYWWVVLLLGICISLVAASRSQKLNTLLRNWFSQWVRSLVSRCDRWVGSEKNAKDSKVQNPHRAPLPSNKTHS